MSINGLEVTDVIIFPLKHKIDNSSLSAFARIILNDAFIVSGVKIFEGKNGPFIKFPQEYNKAANKGYDVCFPITAELRNYISDQVLSQYSLTVQAKSEPA
jgi:DNA-binding cell septation regulator SpoVG